MKSKNKILRFDQKGGATAISDEITESSDDLLWIQLDSQSVKNYLKTIEDVPVIAAEMLTAKQTRPRVLIHLDGLIASFRGVNLNPDSAPEDMISIRVWIEKNRIITVHNRRLKTIAEIQHALSNGHGPKNAAEFIETLLATLTEKSGQVVEKLDQYLDGIEDSISEKHPKSITRSELINMRRRIILLKRYLLPQRDAMNRMLLNQFSWLDTISVYKLQEIQDINTRLLEDLDAERDRADLIHEDMYTVSQEAMNNKMYMLTIVAMIFMPLSFITGLLGVNVGGIPGMSFNYGFMILCIILIIIFAVQLFYLKKKSWI